jgi:hypothetical protein
VVSAVRSSSSSSSDSIATDANQIARGNADLFQRTKTASPAAPVKPRPAPVKVLSRPKPAPTLAQADTPTHKACSETKAKTEDDWEQFGPGSEP